MAKRRQLDSLLPGSSRGDRTRIIAAFLLGFFFLATALLKANSPAGAQHSFAYLLEKVFSLEPSMPATYAAATNLVILVVALEVALGALLMIGWRRRTVVIAALTILAFFTVGLVILAIDPLAPSCGCTGAIRMAHNARMENLISLGRNALLMAGCIWLLSPRTQVAQDAATVSAVVA